MEVISWNLAKTRLDSQETLEWIHVFNGLSADDLVQYHNESKVCGIQVKTKKNLLNGNTLQPIGQWRKGEENIAIVSF